MQALAAASKTVDCLKMVHSLHAIFLIAGDNNSKVLKTYVIFCHQLADQM
jgi:acyl-CoA thioesterase